MTTQTPKIGIPTKAVKKATQRYTEAETKELIMLYEEDPTKENVEYLSLKFNKSQKSIISKLSREGVYVSTGYKPKYGEKPITKEEIVTNVAKMLGIEEYTLEGLAKSNKSALLALEKALDEVFSTSNGDSSV